MANSPDTPNAHSIGSKAQFLSSVCGLAPQEESAISALDVYDKDFAECCFASCAHSLPAATQTKGKQTEFSIEA
jgi:hypothetical protein